MQESLQATLCELPNDEEYLNWHLKYNPAIKSWFINRVYDTLETSESIKPYHNVMVRLDYFENKYKKLINYFDEEELRSVVQYNQRGNAASIRGKKDTISILRRFVQEAFDGDKRLLKMLDDIENPSTSSKDYILGNYVRDYQYLYDYIQKYFPFLFYQNPFYFATAILSFFGLEKETIMTIRREDVDFNARTIKDGEGNILLSKLPFSFMNLLHQCTVTKHIYSGFRKQDICDDGYLIEQASKTNMNVRDRASNISYLTNVMTFLSGITNWDFIDEPTITFRHHHLVRSGQFDKIHKYELENGKIGYVSRNEFNKIMVEVIGETKNHIANYYLEFENWQKVFYG